MPAGNLREMQNRKARLRAPSIANFRKMRILPLCAMAFALQACGARSPDLAPAGLMDTAASVPANGKDGEDVHSSRREDLVAQARALASGERGQALNNEEMVAALLSRKAKTGAEPVASFPQLVAGDSSGSGRRKALARRHARASSHAL